MLKISFGLMFGKNIIKIKKRKIIMKVIYSRPVCPKLIRRKPKFYSHSKAVTEIIDAL